MDFYVFEQSEQSNIEVSHLVCQVDTALQFVCVAVVWRHVAMEVLKLVRQCDRHVSIERLYITAEYISSLRCLSPSMDATLVLGDALILRTSIIW